LSLTAEAHTRLVKETLQYLRPSFVYKDVQALAYRSLNGSSSSNGGKIVMSKKWLVTIILSYA